MFTLQNEWIRFSVDSRGRLAGLANLVTGREYAGNGGIWRIIFSHGIVLEEAAEAENAAQVEVDQQDDSIRITWSRPDSDFGPVDFRVVVTARLDGCAVRFDARVENHAPGTVLREFQFPLLKNLRLTPLTELFWSHLGGRRITDLAAHFADNHTRYMGQDNKAVEFSTLYPGIAGMNCYIFGEPTQSLLVASYDPEFRNTLHLMRQRGREVDATLVKYPFLNPGESCEITGYELAVPSGDWHTAADRYRAWCDTWMKVPDKPASIRDSNGWHRLIMRHQYGKQFFHYRDLPRILQSGLEAGIDTLFMFGWHAGGHDSCYPEYEFAEEEGGFEELRKQIADFQKKGGHVILYYNGQLIDTNTDFYREVGRRIAVKLASGREYMETYPFGGDGTALRWFGNKVFVTACPACSEWHAHLKKLIDRAIELGCDGVFFDQLGSPSRPCFDPSHGHRVPFMDVFKTKAAMIAELRDYIKSRRPEMSFGIEWFNDVTGQHVDYIHNITGGTDPGAFLEFSRYLFPEIIISDRDIRDDTDIERRVNHALRLGLHSDVEIYRCRALIDETPRYKAYLTVADAFRARNREFLRDGRFRDICGASCSTPALEYSVFDTSGTRGVILTQSSESVVTARITVPGGRYRSSDRIGEATALADSPESVIVMVPCNTLLLLKFDLV